MCLCLWVCLPLALSLSLSLSACVRACMHACMHACVCAFVCILGDAFLSLLSVTVHMGALAVCLLHQPAHAAATGCLGLASGKAVARVCRACPMWSRPPRSCWSVRPYMAGPRLHCPVSERSHRQPCPAGARGTDAKRNLVQISTPVPRSIFASVCAAVFVYSAPLCAVSTANSCTSRIPQYKKSSPSIPC